jgi:phospholipid N-methyltransferase
MKPDAPAKEETRPRRALGAFLSRFVRDPRSVGAVAPSSRFLASKMVSGIDFEPGVRVVEFGPGTGPFTEAILERLPEDGRYLGIERDATFAAHLRSRFPDADVVEDSVENLIPLLTERELLPVDHIVSGLPFASLPREVTGAVLEATSVALRKGGTFTTFQYVHSFPLPSAVRFRRRMAGLFGPLSARRVEVRNLPPALVFSWRKPG